MKCQANKARDPAAEALKLRRQRLKQFNNALSVMMEDGYTATVASTCSPDAVEKLRLETVRAFMCCGCPLKYIDGLMPFFNRHALHVGTNSSHLGQYIPDVVMSERLKMQKEFAETALGLLVSFFLDGTQHHGKEVCNVVSRWIHSETFQPVQRLVHLGFLKNSMNAEAIVAEARVAKEKLTSADVIPIPVAVHHDRVAANYAAARTLKEIHRWTFVVIGCVPHTCDNSGKRFETSALNKMQQALNAMIKNSLKIQVQSSE